MRPLAQGQELPKRPKHTVACDKQGILSESIANPGRPLSAVIVAGCVNPWHRHNCECGPGTENCQKVAPKYTLWLSMRSILEGSLREVVAKGA